jgi:hypothetical protein
MKYAYNLSIFEHCCVMHRHIFIGLYYQERSIVIILKCMTKLDKDRQQAVNRNSNTDLCFIAQYLMSFLFTKLDIGFFFYDSMLLSLDSSFPFFWDKLIL